MTHKDCLQETLALESEQALRRENSHLQALVDAGTGPGSNDDSAIAALQKSFNELMQEREQQACSTSCFTSTLVVPDGSPMGCTVCRSRFIAYLMM